MKFSVLGVLLLLSFGLMAQTPTGEFITNEDSTITVKYPKAVYGTQSYRLSSLGRYTSEIISEDNLCQFLGLGAALKSFKSKSVDVLDSDDEQAVLVLKDELIIKEFKNPTVIKSITCFPKGENFIAGKRFSSKRTLSDGSVYFENPKFEDGNQYIYFDSKSAEEGVCHQLGFTRAIGHTKKFLKTLESGALVDVQGERIKDNKGQLFTLQVIATVICD